MKLSTSPKTGDRLITFASSNNDFEFHVYVDKITNISFVERNELKICRLLNGEGKSACSLILKDASDDALKWFHATKIKFSDVE